MRKKMGKEYVVKDVRATILAKGTLRECAEQLGITTEYARKLVYGVFVPKHPKYIFQHIDARQRLAPPYQPLSVREIWAMVAENRQQCDIEKVLAKCEVSLQIFQRMQTGRGNPSTFTVEVLLGEIGAIDLTKATLQSRIMQTKSFAFARTFETEALRKSLHGVYQRVGAGQTLRLNTLNELAKEIDIDPRWLLGIE